MDAIDKLKEIRDFEPVNIKISEKIIQAIRIRAKLVSEKIKWIEKSQKAEDDEEKKESLLILRRCLKNEKRFIEILDSGLQEQIETLQKIKARLREVKVKGTLIKHIDFLLWTLEYSSGKMERIKSRIEAEDNILKKGRIYYDEEFMAMWRKEIKYDKKLAKKLNPSKIRGIKEFSGKFGVVAAGLAGGGVAGAAAASSVFLVSIVGPFAVIALENDKENFPIAKITASIVVALGAIIGAVCGVSYAMEKYEDYLYKIQLKEIKELKKHPIFS